MALRYSSNDSFSVGKKIRKNNRKHMEKLFSPLDFDLSQRWLSLSHLLDIFSFMMLKVLSLSHPLQLLLRPVTDLFHV